MTWPRGEVSCTRAHRGRTRRVAHEPLLSSRIIYPACTIMYRSTAVIAQIHRDADMRVCVDPVFDVVDVVVLLVEAGAHAQPRVRRVC